MRNQIKTQFFLDTTITLLVIAVIQISILMTPGPNIVLWIVSALLVLCIPIDIKIMFRDFDRNTVKFCRLNSDAMLPEKRGEDAGYDIYACFPEKWMVIHPGTTIMIPTGIASVFYKKFVAVLKERGSTGTKGMGQRAGVIDSGYRGEWMVPITNHNTFPIVILKEDYIGDWKFYLEENGYDGDDYLVYPYNKAICQALILPVPLVDVKEIPNAELKTAESERGKGKLGSSGK